MAVLRACGFECGAGTTGLEHIYGAGSFSTAQHRGSGLRSYQTNPSGNKEAGYFPYAAADYERVVRVYIYIASAPTALGDIFGCDSQGGGPLGIVYDSADGKLYTGRYDGGGSLSHKSSSGIAVSTGQWIRLDLRLNTSANPWTIDAQVDGTAIPQLTVALAASPVQGVHLGNFQVDNTFDIYWDDAAISHTASDYPLSPGYILGYIPNADGTHNIAGANDFERSLTGTDILNSTTDAYTLINKRPAELSPTTFINVVAPPNATDYVEWQYEDSVESEAPRYVDAIFFYSGPGGAGTANWTVTLRNHATGSSADIWSGAANPSSISTRHAMFLTIPGTSDAWTLTAFDALRSRLLCSDASPDIYISAIMLEAEYPESNARTLTPTPATTATDAPAPTLGRVGPTLTPDAATTASATPTPTVGHVLTRTPDAVAAASAIPAPTLYVGAAPQTVTPSPSASVTAIPTPTFAHTKALTPTPSAAVTETAAPTIGFVLMPTPVAAGTSYAPPLFTAKGPSPVIRTDWQSNDGSNLDSFDVWLPPHDIDDLLFVLVDLGPGAAHSVTAPGAWTKLWEQGTPNGGYGSSTVSLFAKKATDRTFVAGVEAGWGRDVACGFSLRSCAVYGWPTALTIADAVGLGTVGSGTGTAPDGPSLSPAWGTTPTLWLAAVGYEHWSTPSSPPSGYPTPKSSSHNDGGVSLSWRTVEAASEDPGAWTMPTSVGWLARTVAVQAPTRNLAPSPAITTTDAPAPTLARVYALAPTPSAAVSAVPDPTLSAARVIQPTPQATATATPAPTFQIIGPTQTLTPTPCAATTTTPSVTVTIWAIQYLGPTPTATTTNAQAVTLALTKALTPTPPAIITTGVAPVVNIPIPMGTSRIEVHDPVTHALIDILDHAYKVSYDLQVNAAPIASFYLPRDDPKWAAIVPFHEVWIYNELNELIDVFRIAPIQERRTSDGTIAQVRLEGYACALQDDIIPAEYIWANQTVTQVLTDILSYQTTPRITLGTVDASLDRTITTRAAYVNLMRAAWETRNIVGGFISVDANPLDPTDRTLNLREDPGQDIGQRIVTGWNLRQISKATETQGIVTKVWALGRGEGVNQLRLSTDKLLDELVTFHAHAGARSTLTFTRDHCRYKGWVIAGAALPDGYEAGKDVRIRPMKVWRGAVDDTANWEQGANERELRSKTNDYIPGGGPWKIDYVHADYLLADAQVATYGILSNVYVNKNLENSAALHLEAMRYLDSVKSPRVSHEIAVADLARIYRGETFERLHLYDKVNVWDDALDITTKDRIVGVQYGDIDDPSTMKITVSTLALADQTPRAVDVRDRVRKYEQEPDGAITLLGPDSFEDNVDATHPYTRYVEIPTEAVSVISVELRMRTRAYRKYEAGASSSDNSQSSSSSTTGEEAYHNHMVQLSGNNTGPASSSQSGNQNATHNHSDPQGGSTGNEGQNHDHDIYHTHGYNMSSSVTDAGSTHTHGMAHTHQHGHTITLTAGIYEGGTATSIQVLVDGNVASATATTLDDFDLIPYLAKNADGTIQRGYHTIVFTPNSVGRIQATISGLLFLQSRGAISG